jgi:putative ABC transport system permease protein
MTIRSRVRAVSRRWLRPAAWERSLHDELQAYLDQEIDARIRAGMPPAEARRTALAEFGGVEQVKERVRSSATGAWVDSVVQDIRQACRALMSSRSYAAWVVGSLAIGMAVTIAGLAVLNALLFLPFPEVTNQEQLVRVSMFRNCGRPDCWVRMSAPTDYENAREGLTGVQGIAAYAIGDIAVTLPEARSRRGVFASPNYFDVLGVRASLGRTFNANDAETRAEIAVIAHSMWIREFDADPAVIGRSIRVSDQFVQIVGVAPPLFVGIDRPRPAGPRRMGVGRPPDVWLPMWLTDRVLPLTVAEQRRQERDFQFVGRLKNGVELPRLQAEAAALARALAASRVRESQGARAEVLRVWRVNPKTWSLTIMVVMPIPILVLAIACVNAANLMLARGSHRQREFAIRVAIGAGRGRVVRQVLIESAVLALLATAVAVPIAWWGLHLAANPWGIPVPLDSTVLVLTVLTAVVSTVAFGLAPALRVSAQQPASTLGPVAARSDAVPAQSRMRRALVVAQVALSLALLATGSQLVSTVRSDAISAGTSERLLIARFDLEPLKLQPGEMESFYRDLLAGASRMRGVEAAGIARHTAVWTFGQGAAPASFTVWYPGDGPGDARATTGGVAGGDLFGAVGLRVLQGRGFTDADRHLRPQVAVVNETAAKALNGPALGSILRVAARNDGYESSTEVRIVGVVEAAIEPQLDKGEAPAAKIYLPSSIQPEPALALYIRTSSEATALGQPLRELVSQIVPRAPVLELGSLAELNERSYATQLWLARAAAVLGAIGLLLAASGLYGVSSYLVAMRSRELAIRMAVGAAPLEILTMVLRQSMRLAVIGLLAGGSAAVAVSRWIQSEYHGILGIDGWALGSTVGVFIIAMFLASAIPAARASRLDPVKNLRDA